MENVAHALLLTYRHCTHIGTEEPPGWVQACIYGLSSHYNTHGSECYQWQWRRRLYQIALWPHHSGDFSKFPVIRMNDIYHITFGEHSCGCRGYEVVSCHSPEVCVVSSYMQIMA